MKKYWSELLGKNPQRAKAMGVILDMMSTSGYILREPPIDDGKRLRVWFKIDGVEIPFSIRYD